MSSFIIWDQVVVLPKIESIEGPGQFKTSTLPVINNDDLNAMQESFRIALDGNTIDKRYLSACADYFFAQFYSHVSNAFYQENESDIIGGGNSFPRKDFFNYKFNEAFIEWGKSLNPLHLQSLQYWSPNSLMSNVNQFALFLETSSNEKIQRIRDTQENVIFYCIDRLLNAMKQTQETEYRYSLDTIKYYHSMTKAQSNLEAIPLPSVKPSSIDARIPDPTSIAEQQKAILEREKQKQAFSLSKDKSRQVETNLQFAKENTIQFQSNFFSLFERNKTILDVLIRF